MSESEYDSSDSPGLLGAEPGAEVEEDSDSASEGENEESEPDSEHEAAEGVERVATGGVEPGGEEEGEGEDSDDSDESDGSEAEGEGEEGDSFDKGESFEREGDSSEKKEEGGSPVIVSDEEEPEEAVTEDQGQEDTQSGEEGEGQKEQEGDPPSLPGGEAKDYGDSEPGPSMAGFSDNQEGSGVMMDLGGQTRAGFGNISGESDDDEMADMVATTSKQVKKFLKDSDSEDEELDLPTAEEAAVRGNKGESGSMEKGESEEKVVEEDEEGDIEGGGVEKGEGIEEDMEGGAMEKGEDEERIVEGGGEEEGEGSQEPWKESKGLMEDVFEEASEDEDMATLQRKRKQNRAEEGSPVRKRIKTNDDSESEGGGGEELAELKEEMVQLEESGGGGVPEGSGEGGTVEEGREGEGEGGSDDELEDEERREVGVSDWDLMMQRRKEAMARARRRRKKDVYLTTNDDDIIAMIRQMKHTAEEDRQLNLERKAATKKLQMLPTVVSHLKKSDLQQTFIECGILGALAEWLRPLPDHSLPHLKIRDSILDILRTFPIPDSNLLKTSKIGKSVMLLYRHPKETKKNRDKAGKLINDWARPIFGLASDFKSLSRDEREERDYANLTQAARRRLSSGGESKRTGQDEEYEPQKPGDRGWIGRARVPMPSTKDYVVRPKWNVEHEFKKTPSKKGLSRYDKQLQKQKQQKMQSKTHAITISIEGRQMPL